MEDLFFIFLIQLVLGGIIFAVLPESKGDDPVPKTNDERRAEWAYRYYRTGNHRRRKR